MAKICSTCGAENRDEAQRCTACGAAFATAAPTASAGYPPPRGALPIPDVPDPRVALDIEREEASTVAPGAAMRSAAATPLPSSPNRTRFWVGLGIAAVVAAGVAWWFVNTAPPAPPVAAQPATAPATALTTTPAGKAEREATVNASIAQREQAIAARLKAQREEAEAARNRDSSLRPQVQPASQPLVR